MSSSSHPGAAAVAVWFGRSLALVFSIWALGRIGAVLLPQGLTQQAALWPAAALALAALLRWGAGMAPAVLAGSFALVWHAGEPWWLATAMAFGASAGPWLALRWLARSRFDPRLDGRRDLLLLVALGLFGATLLGASNGAAWLAAAGRISPVELLGTGLSRWLGESLALLLVGLPLISGRADAWRRAYSAGRGTATTLMLVAIAAASSMAGGLVTVNPAAVVALLMLPPVLLCALSLRCGAAVASPALLVLCAVPLLAAARVTGLSTAIPTGLADPALLGYLASATALVWLPNALHSEQVQMQQRWQWITEASDLGMAEWNSRTGIGSTSPRWRALLGDADGSGTATVHRWLARVHPDDQATVLAGLTPLSGPTGGGLRRELRLLVHGAWRWFDLQLSVLERDAVGTPTRVVAWLADIGARRNAQDRSDISSNLFIHLHEGLLITDAQMRVVDANPSYTRITGVPRDELLGRPPGLLRTGREDRSHDHIPQAAMWAELRSSGRWTGEIVDRHRSGAPCALHVTVSALNGPDGEVRYHVWVLSDITEQRLQKERLERQAHTDELTRLPNRAQFGQLLAGAMHSADACGQLLAVCCLDLDHFKRINDQHGPDAGDRLLAQSAIRLRAALRTRGGERDDVAARLGGDEFALLLHAGSLDELRGEIERLLQVVAQPHTLVPGAEPTQVTASVGATVYPIDGSDGDTLLRHADHAMYSVKQAGRNGYVFFDAEHRRRNEEKVIAIGRVQEALDDDELTLYYQPKVDLRRGVVIGFEALLRWNHPEQGVVSPAMFLPLIEHTGLSASVGDHVLSSAIDQLDRWRSQGLDLSVSVNISARHLQERDFVQRLAELLARRSLPLGPALELEVIETAALTDIDYTSSLLERCARLGVRWALDDFGTGYSTLTYLKRLPVQVLKIDRSFVQNMLTDAQDRAIVEGVIRLAQTFGCVAVAEGIESAAQARLLLDLGCEIGQGEGIAAPMPPEQVPAWIANWRGMFALAPAGAARAPGAA